MSSIREELEKRANQQTPQGEEEETQQQQQQQQPPQQTTPLKAASDKDTNLRTLALAKEEAERKLEEAEQRAKQFEEQSSLLKDERYQKLLGLVDTEYEADPEKLLTEFETFKTERTSFTEKLTEKEKLIEKIKFEESDSYKINVKQPIESGEERLKGVLKKDDALFKKIKQQFLYDKDRKVLSGDLNADEIIALDEILEEHGGSIKSERVETAIVALREGFHKAQDYYQNHQRLDAEASYKSEQAKALENAEQAKLAKIVRASAVKKSLGEFLGNDMVKTIFGEEYVNGAGKTVLTEIEAAIETRQVPTMESMASRQMKARLWDKLVEDGGLDIIREAIATQEEHGQRGAGTKGSGTGPAKPSTKSIRDQIAEKAGVTGRFR